MLNASGAFKRELYKGNRDYFIQTDMTLRDGAELSLKDSEHMEGGLSVEDATSSDGSFDVGAAIVNKCVLTLNNIYDDFSAHDFTDAKVTPYVGLRLPDGTVEPLRKGTFTVDEAKYNGAVITLTCLDNMMKFDKPYRESPLTYPATLGQIVRDACERCGVELQTLTFPNDGFIVRERPNDEAATFREVISWAAQIACCFCRCNAHGRLELKWYDWEALERAGLDGGIFDKGNPAAYESGDDADGGSFKPWSEGAEFDGGDFKDLKGVHSIYSLFDMSVATDDVVITGVRVTEKAKEGGEEAVRAYQSGKDGYVISVEGNELIRDGAGEAVAEFLGERLIGFRFRPASATHLSDPTIEAGDVGFLTDRKGNAHRIVISNTKFTVGDSQRTSCNAQTPARNSATRYSAETKNYVEYRKALEKERGVWELALEGLADALENGSGLYQTEEPQPNGSTVRYFHDKPKLSDSATVIKISGRAFGLSSDGGKTYPYGIDFSGKALLDEIYAIGINAKYINAGALSIKTKAGKETLYADTETGQVRIVADSFSLTSGKTIEGIAEEAASNKNKVFTSTPITPYNVGDLWMASDKSEVKVCVTAKAEGKAFSSNDWKKRDNYVDAAQVPAVWADTESGATQDQVLKKLTNNYTDKGIYLQGDKLYISFNAARGGELTLGGADNDNGVFRVYDADSSLIGKWDNDGFMTKGRLFAVDENGQMYSNNPVAIGGLYMCGSVFGPNSTTNANRSKARAFVAAYNSGSGGETGTYTLYICEPEIDDKWKFTRATTRVPFSCTKGVEVGGGLKLNGLENVTSGSALVADRAGNVGKGEGSSKRYKDIEANVSKEDVEGLYEIKPVWAKFKEGYLLKGDERNGVCYPMLIAEDVDAHLPYAADHNSDGTVENWNHRVIIPYMIQALKEQKKEIDELKSIISNQ